MNKKISIGIMAIVFVVAMCFSGLVFPSKAYADDGTIDMDVYPGKSGELSYFDLYAENCNGFSWSLSVNDGAEDIIVLRGTITYDSWDAHYYFYLSEGDYTATFSVVGVDPKTVNFSVEDFASSINVFPGYAGETTTFILNVSSLSGGTAYFSLRKVIDDFYYEPVYAEDGIPIDSDDWSYEINQTLAEGHYSVYFTVNDVIAGGDDFSVVNRPTAPSAPPKPLTPEEQAALDLSIEKQVAIYGANNVGFVKTLYDNILGRAADEGGLNAWVTALNEGKITLRDIVFGFVFSKELESVISPAGPEEYITFLYENVLGRSPDPDGLNNWITNMQNGMTKEEVLLHFVDSEEFNKICEMFGL